MVIKAKRCQELFSVELHERRHFLFHFTYCCVLAMMARTTEDIPQVHLADSAFRTRLQPGLHNIERIDDFWSWTVDGKY